MSKIINRVQVAEMYVEMSNYYDIVR